MTIKFTIVMPCYNAEKFIQYAIDSVVEQSYKNYELIVVDGGSIDGTMEILKFNYNKIDCLISETDDGQSDAFNKGFSLAKGNFFLWLNADDLLMPKLLEDAANFLGANKDCNWLACHTVFIDKNGFVKNFHHGPGWNEYLNITHRPQVECPTSIFHRDLFNEAGGFDLRLHYSMDLDLWRTFIKNGHKWSRLDRYGYIFRIHDDSKTNKETTPAHSSPDEIFQGEILRLKHKINYKISSIIISRILKLFLCMPYSYLDRLRWRGIHISEYIKGSASV